MPPKKRDEEKSPDFLAGDDDVLQVIRESCNIPQLDVMLGGGFPRRRMGLLIGDYSSGKSWLCLNLIREIQRRGGKATFVDAERTYDRDWAAKVGVDTANLKILQTELGEDALDAVVYCLRQKDDIVVLDSVAALLPEQEQDANMDEPFMGVHARMWNRALRKITANNEKTVFVAINQVRQSLKGGWGIKEDYPGGEGQKFHASYILRISRGEAIKEGENRIGFFVECLLLKSKISAPYQRCSIPFNYSLAGVDNLYALIEEGMAAGIIKRSGPSYTFLEKHSATGRLGLRQYLTDNPDAAKELQKKLDAIQK